MRRNARWLVAPLALFVASACGDDEMNEPTVVDGGGDAGADVVVLPTAPCAIRFGDVASQAVRDVAVDREGRTIAIGTFDGAMKLGSITIDNPIGRTSSFVVALDATCTPVFARSYHSGITSVAVDDSGAIYIATAGVDPTKDETTFSEEVFVAKLAKDGSTLWSKALASSLPRPFGSQTAARIQAKRDGTLLVTVLLERNLVTLVDGSKIGDQDSTDGVELAAVLSSDGDLRFSAWAQPETVGSIGGAISENGDIAIVGECANALNVDDGALACDHGFVAKIGGDGKVGWLRTGPFEGGPIAFDPSNGDVVVAPKIPRAATYPADFPADTKADDRMLAKLSAKDGTAQWMKRTGTSPLPAPFSGIAGIAIDAKGSIFVSGDARSSAWELSSPAITNRAFVAELAPDGTQRRAATYGDVPITLTRPALGPDGSLSIGGALLSKADFGTGAVLTSTQWQSADGFVVRKPALEGIAALVPRPDPAAPTQVSTTPTDISDFVVNASGVFLRSSDALFGCDVTGCPATPTAIATGLETGSMLATETAVLVGTRTKGVLSCTRTACTEVVPAGSAVTGLAVTATDLYFIRDFGAYTCPITGCTTAPVWLMSLPVPTSIAISGTTLFGDDGHKLSACTLPACDVVRTVLETFDGNTLPRPIAISPSGLFLGTHGAAVRCPLDIACDPKTIFAGNVESLTTAGTDVYFESGHDTDALLPSSVWKCPASGCTGEGVIPVSKRVGRPYAYANDLWFVGDGRLSRIAR